MSNDAFVVGAIVTVVWLCPMIFAAVVSFNVGRNSAAEAIKAYRDHVANLNEIMDRYHRMLFTGGADCGDD